jgi:hypothetical protein
VGGAISDGRPYRDKLGALEVAFLELLDEVMKSFLRTTGVSC